MSKSSLRKDQRKSVTTNLSIGWVDDIIIVATIVETGRAIYVIPRKGEASFQRMLWTYQINADPSDVAVNFAILRHGPFDATVDLSQLGLAVASLLFATQAWRSLTAVGVLNTSNTIEVDMKEMVISRGDNLQGDNEFTIVPAYRSNSNFAVGQSGILWVKETLFQDIFKDDLDEWAGYTFEESAS